ncbi:MAG: hypothetical protein LAP21_14040 [Acidobacteriia bacterium]|nr:hypothetical protein [Terriglobia bacterium]
MATVTNVPASPSLAQFLNARRSSAEPIHIALPVKVFSDVRCLTPEWSCTYEITARNARLMRTPCIQSVGQEIWLQRNNRRAKFRITWISDSDSSQYRAECMEERPIWDDDLMGRLIR